MELTDVKGIGRATIDKLNRLNIFSPTDLIMFMPTKYTNLKPVFISEIKEGYFYTVKVVVTKILKNIKLNKIKLFSVLAIDKNDDLIEINWFNQEFISKIIYTNTEYIFYGKVTKNKDKLTMTNPEYERSDNCKKLKGIKVEYNTKGLLTSFKINGFIKEIIDGTYVKSFIDEDLAAKYNVIPLNKALYNLHFPLTEEDINKNIDRINLEKIINTMLVYNSFRKNLQRKRTFHYSEDKNVLNECIMRLPYNLTDSQKNAISLLIDKLKDENNINYLLLGDVGSGKTIVAMLLCYYAVLSKGKAVMLTPSETLLAQHYATASFFQNNMRIAKLSNSSTKSERKDVINRLKKGEIDMLLGTHSLINDEIELGDFTFAVIDEQQKFGVNQKGNLLKKLANVDSLLLSATPIPRAINLMFYNELNVIEIFKPIEKKTNVDTKLVSNDKLMNMLEYIAYKSSINEKSFVVCPNIDSNSNCKGVNEIYNILTEKFKAKAVLLNSKLSEEDKYNAVKNFSEGEYNILVATTIIEVGIDIQNAKNMVVINSERFGLSALHQLRGRVGRNGEKANCFLHYDNLTENAKERLNIIKKYNDGFVISKLDYELRGGGDICGVKQSGKINTLIEFDMIKQDLLQTAQNIYSDILKENKDIDLTDIYNAELLYSKIGEIVLA